MGGGKGASKGARQKMKTQKKKSTPALFAGLAVAAVAAAGSTHQLATPPPSEYVDAESSVNITLPTNEGRHIKLTLAFDPSPTNAVQVAFGRDDDGDGDLAPEETVVRVGCDCGEIQVKVEGEGEQWNWSTYSAGQSEQEGNILCSPSPLTFTLKQPKAVAARWDLAKVTTHNVDGTNVAVTAKFYSTGFALILR